MNNPGFNPMLLKIKRFLVPLAVACMFFAHAGRADAVEFELEAGATRFGDFALEHFDISHGVVTEIGLSGISHPALGALGDVMITCEARSVRRCGGGDLVWSQPDRVPLAFGFERDAAGIRLGTDAGAFVRYQWPDGENTTLEFGELSLAWIPPDIRQATGVSALAGKLGGSVAFDPGTTRAAIRLEELEFDTPDGRYAGAGLVFDVDLRWQPSSRRIRLEAGWRSGELLLGPAYLPVPARPVEFSLDAAQQGDSTWQVEHLRLVQEDALVLDGDALIQLADGVHIAGMTIDVGYLSLGPVWRQGLDSIAATLGWGQLDPVGRLDGRLRIEGNALASVGLRLSDAGIEDAAGRIQFDGLGAWVDWERAGESLRLGANWRDARLFRIPLGASMFELASRDDGTLALVNAFRLPVLDGALVMERLEWHDWAGPERQLGLDARIEPVDLSGLTNALGLTEFGGLLSGRFPGIRLIDSVIDVQGELQLELFGGNARIDNLSIERPFGSLPALAADIEFQALDLEQVTGAFEIGRMLGLMSGHIRDLRLLDWQPVRFDAWFETLEDSPERKISQKAVGSISSLSGGGSAALSGTLLRWFDDFPYRKVGLGCRLDRNVCRMRGLRDTEQGGYLILEGRFLPRLDIVGYKRQVDWPRLLAQLAAASASAE